MTLVIGPDWRVEVERDDPGLTAAMERDVLTFLDSDLPRTPTKSPGSSSASSGDIETDQPQGQPFARSLL